ncbi:MAG: (2Fe-2S)-binding protein [Deltaproteobacteria bacterium]|nr:(2Fe-2S)-binding protein [Deltaproteobacteria bacterium]
MASIEPTLRPQETKDHRSVAAVRRAWYVAAESRELGDKPLAATLLGQPLVLFRDGGRQASALLDRCAHRNVPLSLGEVTSGQLQCGYHGWRYDGSGICRHIPGLCGESEGPARRVPSFPCKESQGYVWVWMDPDVEPDVEPWSLPELSPRYTRVRKTVMFPGSVHATLENALDVPHTAFLHKGYFRGSGASHELEVVVRRYGDRVEAQYIGEPRPSGLAGLLLAPGGGIVEHYDRFFLPSVGQVEYRLGERSHFLVTSICTPVTDFETRVYAEVAFRLPFPGWLVRPFIQPLALRIFEQDRVMLQAQTEHIERFGGEQFVSTEIDVLGGAIWRLLRAAERGEVQESDELEERRLKLRT